MSEQKLPGLREGEGREREYTSEIMRECAGIGRWGERMVGKGRGAAALPKGEERKKGKEGREG